MKEVGKNAPMSDDSSRVLGVPVGWRVEYPLANVAETVEFRGAEILLQLVQLVFGAGENVGSDGTEPGREMAEEELPFASLVLKLANCRIAFLSERDIQESLVPQ